MSTNCCPVCGAVGKASLAVLIHCLALTKLLNFVPVAVIYIVVVVLVLELVLVELDVLELVLVVLVDELVLVEVLVVVEVLVKTTPNQLLPDQAHHPCPVVSQYSSPITGSVGGAANGLTYPIKFVKCVPLCLSGIILLLLY